MSYCINPNCDERCNPDNLNYCQGCGSNLIIGDRYRIIKPLRKLDGKHHTEVFEVDNHGTPKILKVLTSNRRLLVKLFKQESKILAQLRCLPVAQLDTQFTFVPHNSEQKLRCLVMEKIAGDNLKQWVEINGRLTKTQAIDWLKQLLLILTQVHQQNILHRDIKPSNIMIRPDGKLILIDFGTARELTETYEKELERSDITRIYSPGYTAPEQLEGKAVCRSDLFALGRTFVYLTTGIYPDDLPKTTTKQLLWQERAPQISSSFANLIDRLIAFEPDERPQELSIINELRDIDDRQVTEIWKRPVKYWQKSITSILTVSLAIASLVIGIRALGWLQPMELQAFDRLMHLRPMEHADSRLLLITVDEADIQYQNQQQMSIRWSLADRALAQLLTTIKSYQPRTIGIDLYRDFAVDANYPELARELQTSDRLFAVCKIPAPEDDAPSGTPPPPEVPLNRLGFSDFVADSGDIIRRQILHLTPPVASPCNAEYAFSLQLALNYLKQQGIASTITSQGYLQIAQTIFKPIDTNSGGYQKIDAAGYQILLNYRSLNAPTDIAQQISLKEILSARQAYSTDNHADEQLKNLIEDRLVIVGVTASSSTDEWQTPYSSHTPGIFIQAQMVSQIVSAVLDRRSLLWWWSNSGETIWIGGWALLGGIIGYSLRHSLWLGVAIALGLLFLFISCWAILLQAGWIPLIPATLAFLLTSVAIVLVEQKAQSHF
jgi:CHASE2 domain-containing sensor protein/predicted Ser/Thr protein kinase